MHTTVSVSFREAITLLTYSFSLSVVKPTVEEPRDRLTLSQSRTMASSMAAM